MERILPATIMMAIAVLALAGMWWGWRSRKQRQSAIALPPEIGEQDAVFSAGFSYVATTEAADPIARIAAYDLGFRGACEVVVGSDGVEIHRVGSRSFLIPTSAITTAGKANWTIDRVVEDGGLVVIEWLLGDLTVATYLRPAVAGDGGRLLTTLTELHIITEPSEQQETNKDQNV